MPMAQQIIHFSYTGARRHAVALHMKQPCQYCLDAITATLLLHKTTLLYYHGSQQVYEVFTSIGPLTLFIIVEFRQYIDT